MVPDVKTQAVVRTPSVVDLELVRRPAVSRVARSRAARTILLAALVVVGLWRVSEYRSFLEAPNLTENDFTTDYVSAREWREGRDAYAPLPEMNLRYFGPDDPTARQYEPDQLNPHPPALILLHSPLSFLSMRGARAVHLGLMLVATFLAVFLFCRALAIDRVMATALAMGALALPIVRFDMRWGQINGLVLLGLVLAWRALRNGRDVRAGLVLGAVIGLKIFPVLLLIPLIRMRRAKAIGWTVLSAAGVTLLGVAAVGVGSTIRFITEASPGNFEIWGAAPHSISLVALPFRLFASHRWLSPGVEVSPLIGLLGIACFVFCVIAMIRMQAPISKDLFWAATPWMVLASPIAWTHYLIVVIPLAVLVLMCRDELPRPQQYVLIAAVAVVALGDSFVNGLAQVTNLSLMRFGTVTVFTALVMAALGMLALKDFSLRRSTEPVVIRLP